MNVCYDIDADTIQLFVFDVTDFSVDDWEPTYDIDLWKDSLQLDVFVQRMEQGDGETLSDLSAQPVYVWSIPENLIPVDTLYIATGAITGVNIHRRNENIRIYPQPATDFICISNLEMNTNIEIYNIADQ
jgi:hypothetical protein